MRTIDTNLSIEWVGDGTEIDLGDRVFSVLHLPGHTPASIALFEEASGTLFSGDVIYDDVLIDDCVGSDIEDYRTTMHRVIGRDVSTVHPGYGPSFDRSGLVLLAREYLDASTRYPGRHQ